MVTVMRIGSIDISYEWRKGPKKAGYFAVDALASWGAALRSRAAGSQDESRCGAIHKSAPTNHQLCQDFIEG